LWVYAQLGYEQGPARHLLALVDMVNQALGDSVSGLLLVEASLRRLGRTLTDWGALYTNLPRRQLKACLHPRARHSYPCLQNVERMA
jgi:phosphoacetylglucosamine mutase